MVDEPSDGVQPSIVQEIGGTIHVESSQEEGTSFIVILPRELNGTVNMKIFENENESGHVLAQRGIQEKRLGQSTGKGVEPDDG